MPAVRTRALRCGLPGAPLRYSQICRRRCQPRSHPAAGPPAPPAPAARTDSSPHARACHPGQHARLLLARASMPASSLVQAELTRAHSSHTLTAVCRQSMQASPGSPQITCQIPTHHFHPIDTLSDMSDEEHACSERCTARQHARNPSAAYRQVRKLRERPAFRKFNVCARHRLLFAVRKPEEHLQHTLL
jgi:hypothetical protein